LSSQIPEEILLAVLANYPKEQTENILRAVVRKLKAVCKNPAQLSKFLKQLILISRLRKIEDLTIKITEDMPITYDIETDYLYNRGIEKGELKATERERHRANIKEVKNLLVYTDFSSKKIAEIVEVSIEFVEEIKKLIGKI
jgi:hypothetical protein